ncbi:hypothetical protein Tco_0320420 [Tanacetum coccineum]
MKRLELTQTMAEFIPFPLLPSLPVPLENILNTVLEQIYWSAKEKGLRGCGWGPGTSANSATALCCRTPSPPQEVKVFGWILKITTCTLPRVGESLPDPILRGKGGGVLKSQLLKKRKIGDLSAQAGTNIRLRDSRVWLPWRPYHTRKSLLTDREVSAQVERHNTRVDNYRQRIRQKEVASDDPRGQVGQTGAVSFKLLEDRGLNHGWVRGDGEIGWCSARQWRCMVARWGLIWLVNGGVQRGKKGCEERHGGRGGRAGSLTWGYREESSRSEVDVSSSTARWRLIPRAGESSDEERVLDSGCRDGMNSFEVESISSSADFSGSVYHDGGQEACRGSSPTDDGDSLRASVFPDLGWVKLSSFAAPLSVEDYA